MSDSSDGIGCGIILAVIIIIGVISAIVEAIVANWSSIVWFFGWVLILGAIIALFAGFIWYVRHGHPALKQKRIQWRRIKKEKLREKIWNDSQLGKNYRKLQSHEQGAQTRIKELKKAIKENKAQRKKFEKILSQSVTTDRLRQKTNMEISQVDQAIDIRMNAIEWYEAALSNINFEKIKIENAKTDYVVKGRASKNYHDANEFMNELDEFITEIEGNLEELYIYNDYGYDEKIRPLVTINQESLRSGKSDTLTLDQEPSRKKAKLLKWKIDQSNNNLPPDFIGNSA